MIGDEQRQLRIETGAADLAPEVWAALVQLAKANDYACHAQVDRWEFAIEIERLIDLGVTTTDLRWLVSSGYVQHAAEVSQPEDEGRRFQSKRNTSFTKTTCFVLTDAGIQLAKGDADSADPMVLPLSIGGATTDETSSTPHWNREARTLSMGGQIVKRFKVPSTNQETVLAAFQEEGWPCRIDDPLPPQAEQDPKYRLHFTIHRLNQSQKQSLIRFFGDGTGEGVCWEVAGAASLAPSADAWRTKRLAA